MLFLPRSRWHASSSCPVNNGKGGKGSYGYPNKGSCGKGNGKSRSKKGSGRNKGKGQKGKSKWTPCRRNGQDYRQLWQERWLYGGEGYFGFRGKKLNDSFHGPPARSSPLKQKRVRFEIEDRDNDMILHLGKPRPSCATDTTEPDPDLSTEEPASATVVEKRLDFPFTLGVFSSLENYRTVKDKRRVLLIDLGLPLALGAEPFRDLLSVLPSERQKEVSAGTSRILEASQHQWHLRNSGARKADALGGGGSVRPTLLRNLALRRPHAAILAGLL